MTIDVDLDDPDFWSKAVGLEAPVSPKKNDAASAEPDGNKRSRRQAQALAEKLKEEKELK